jgi:hypothetical protein
VYGCDRIVLTVWQLGQRRPGRTGHRPAAKNHALPTRLLPAQDLRRCLNPGKFPVFFAHMNGDYGEMPYGIPHEDPSLGVKITTFYGWDTVDKPSEVDYTPSQSGPSASAASPSSTSPMPQVR